MWISLMVVSILGVLGTIRYASLLAQKTEPFTAAYAAVCLHGAAGDRCAERLSQHAMLPTDLIEALPAVFRAVEG